MRILTVGPSGIISMQRPVQWALQQGHEVWLLDDQNPFGRVGAHYHYVHFWAKRWAMAESQHVRHVAPRFATWLGVRQLQLLVKAIQPDLVHAHFFGFATACCVQAQVKPLIVSVWGALNSLLHSGQLNVSDRKIWGAADALIVENPQLLHQCRLLARAGQQVELVPLGVDTHHFRLRDPATLAGWRRTLNIPQGTLVLLSPRGWAANYGHHAILAAYAQILPYLQTPSVLLFVKLRRSHSPQAAEAYYQSICQQAAQLGVTEHLRWAPELPYSLMPSFYALADLVINYPANDAFPSTLLEAAACERPIITAALPGYRGTWIEEFCTLVEPQSPTALAAALAEMVNRLPLEQKTRLAAARRAVAERYDETICQAQLMALYQTIATRPRQSAPATRENQPERII